MRMSKFLMTGAAVLTAVPTLAATAPKQSTTPTDSSPAASAPATSSSAAPAPAVNASASTAPASGTVTVGATVRDTNGGTVGTIESLDGQYAVLTTGKSKVRLPLSSFGKGADGPTLAMTQAQVDAAASAAAKTGAP